DGLTHLLVVDGGSDPASLVEQSFVITGNTIEATSSWAAKAVTSSFVAVAQSASYVSASNIVGSSLSTGSLVPITSSAAITASHVKSSSYASFANTARTSV